MFGQCQTLPRVLQPNCFVQTVLGFRLWRVLGLLVPVQLKINENREHGTICIQFPLLILSLSNLINFQGVTYFQLV